MYTGLVVGGPYEGEERTSEMPTWRGYKHRPLTIWAIPSEAAPNRDPFEEIEYSYLPLDEQTGVWTPSEWTNRDAWIRLIELARRD